MALHSCPSAVLYYRAVITWEVITGLYLYTQYMIHVVTKVGSAHRVPASDSGVGAERTGGSIPVVVGLGSQRPSTVTFFPERQGRLRPPRREVGLALAGVRDYIK